MLKGQISFCLFLVLSAPLNAQTQTRSETVYFEQFAPPSEPSHFNWFYSGSRRDRGAHQVMWEPLFVTDPRTGKLEPWLAASVPVGKPPFKVWTIELRRDVFWSDGRPFTARDVEFSVELAVKHEGLPASEAATLRANLPNFDKTLPQYDAVKPIGNHTVEFHLTKPNPRFLEENFGASMYGAFLIMPEHIWETRNPEKTEGFAQSIGTGPYKLESADQNSITWARDDNWWGVRAGKTLPAPKRLVWLNVGDMQASKQMLLKGELDAARPYSAADFAEVQAAGAKVIAWNDEPPIAWSEACPRQLEFNTEREPWADPRVRLAVSFLIDRTELARVGYAGATRASQTMFVDWPSMKPYIDAVTSAGFALPPSGNASKAQSFLTAAGYTLEGGGYRKNGVAIAGVITVDNSNAQDVNAAKELAKQLTTGGLQVSVKSVSRSEYWGKAIPMGDFDLAYSWLSCGSATEPFTSMRRYAAKAVSTKVRSPGFNNTGRWKGEQADKYAVHVATLEGLPATDPKALKALTDAYAVLDAEMPFVPLVQSPGIIPFSTKYWTGWPTAVDPYSAPMHSWAGTHRIIQKLVPVTQ